MSRFLVGNVFLLLSMACAAGSQVLLKALLREVPPPAPSWSTLAPLLTPDRLLRGGIALGLIVAGFLFWVLCLARLELSYAYPIACSSVVLVAALASLVLGEPMGLRAWSGTLLILLGIVLLTPGRS